MKALLKNEIKLIDGGQLGCECFCEDQEGIVYSIGKDIMPSQNEFTCRNACCSGWRHGFFHSYVCGDPMHYKT